jgi:hypothetical protein
MRINTSCLELNLVAFTVGQEGGDLLLELLDALSRLGNPVAAYGKRGS